MSWYAWWVIALAAASLTVCVLPAPAAAIELPVRIDTSMTLRQQYGYAPGYQLNVPSFDANNRPVIRSRTASQHVTRTGHLLRTDGTWRRSNLLRAVRAAYPRFVRTVNAGGYVSERIEFDTLGRAYTLLEIRVRGGRCHNLLLYSANDCRSWRVLTLPFSGKRVKHDGRYLGSAMLEQYSGWNRSASPPLVAVWRPISDWRGNRAARYALSVVKPRWRGSRLVLPQATRVSKRFIGVVYGAGGASFACSQGRTSYLVWAEVARPQHTGTPTYVCSFDDRTRTITRPKLLAQARPRNDDHDTPGIVRDGNGYLHVMTGAHNSAFYYTRSLNPLDVSAWTEPEAVLQGGYLGAARGEAGRARQTYLSLACLPDNSLVVVFRQWRSGLDVDWGGAGYESLSVQRMSADGVWGEAQRLVMSGSRSGYVCYHQKLNVDNFGRLYLSLSYFNPSYYSRNRRAANRFRHRMVLVSKDGGTTWEFATVDDFVEGMTLAQ